MSRGHRTAKCVVEYEVPIGTLKKPRLDTQTRPDLGRAGEMIPFIMALIVPSLSLMLSPAFEAESEPT